MQDTILNLPIFTHLSDREMAPVEDFPDPPVLLCKQAPDVQARSTIRFVIGNNTRFEIAENDEVERLLKLWRAKLSPDIEDDIDEELIQDDDHLRDLASEAPVIRLVNHFIERSMDLNASDIHFEPEESAFAIRCRVDGVMSTLDTLPVNQQPAIASRLKLMAKLDIGEKRLPQDGRIQYTMGRKKLDMRVSTLPGVYGESIVLRILDRSDVAVSLDKLGMPEEIQTVYERLINQPNGMILITGPTGSGKTTTLYGSLQKIKTGTQKIITVEDPVEYQLDGITQVQVNAKIGLDFAAGLRSILRQDPDIVMVGEIRDRETAGIAIESALTGHVVFSTLHTNDSASAVVRLQDMGIDGYLISSSILAVMAQRLVRKICSDCKYESQPTDEEIRKLDLGPVKLSSVMRGKGCSKCGGTGYRGRVGLYELLVFTDGIRHEIAAGADASTINKQGIKEGMRTLRKDALLKLQQGITTPEEIIRVTRSI